LPTVCPVPGAETNGDQKISTSACCLRSPKLLPPPLQSYKISLKTSHRRPDCFSQFRFRHCPIQSLLSRTLLTHPVRKKQMANSSQSHRARPTVDSIEAPRVHHAFHWSALAALRSMLSFFVRSE